MALTETLFDSADALTAAFAARIATLLENGIVQKGRASLVVSGGRTPLALFKTLSETDLAWDKVDITLADERWVGADDDASNEKLVRSHLLTGLAAKANFVGLKTSHADAKDAVAECSERISQVAQPFDVLILGMGEDGHTASLFPCSKEVADGLDLNNPAKYIAVQPTTAPHQRMSLTLAALLNSKQIFLHLTGNSKKQVLQNALSGSDELQMPIRAVITRAAVELLWAP